MKINLKQELTHVDGEYVRLPDSDVCLTLGFVCLDILVHPNASDQQPVPGAAVRLFNMTQRIYSASNTPSGAVDLPLDDIAFLQKRIETSGRYAPYIVGQVLTLLENGNQNSDENP